MKARLFSSVFIVLMASSFLLVGCGWKLPTDTKQLVLTMQQKNLSVGSQPAVGDFSAVALDNSNVADNLGETWGTAPVLPYSWKIGYYNEGNQLIELVEEYSGASFQVKFYVPGRYHIEVSLRQGFGPDGVTDAEVWTGKALDLHVTQGAGYSPGNFIPGVMISTSTGATVMQSTQIIIIRDWGVAAGYNPPADNDPVDNDPGRDGTFIVGVGNTKVGKGQTFTVEGTIEGLGDHFSGKFWGEANFVDVTKIEAIAESGWTITSDPEDFPWVTASNTKPDKGKVVAFKVTLKAKQLSGTTGLNFQSCEAQYKGETLQVNSVDGWVKIE